jgi:phosphatidylcholine synthase
MNKVVVWAVHLLTASGAAVALAAATATARGQWTLAFLFLGIAFVIDGIDGPLARRFRVSERLPWFDGAILDLVVDYITYVFIPAVIIADGGLISEPLASLAGMVVAVVGALYFADTRMKTANSAFRGFPALWNIVAFLAMVYRPHESVTLAFVAGLAVLTFLPVEFVHPFRVERFRNLTLVVIAVWAILAIIALIANLNPGLIVKVGLSVTTFYLAVVGAALQVMRSRRAARSLSIDGARR